MTVNESMLIVAKKLAKRYGYIEVYQDILNARNDKFWGNKFIGLTSSKPVIINRCKYILPIFEGEENKKKCRPKIEIDMHWGNPRINVALPDGTFACLTYKDNIFTEAQAFEDNGLKLALLIKEEIDSLSKQ